MRVLLLGHHVFTQPTGGHDVVYRDCGDTLEGIYRTLPPGWTPELIVFRIPEYYMVPPDMVDAPCPTVALVSDWNLHYEAPLAVFPAFDHIFTERLGVETFRRAGFEHVSYFPLFGYRPNMHSRLDPAEQAFDYDISIVANLNPRVQRERAGWIQRLARLSNEYRVGILTNVHEEAYTRVVQRSRITFNRSIRREMNMRAYEAPACGSLLFLEADNAEVRDLLQDRKECVLYDDDNFEELVKYYLEHEDERAQIAEAGWRAIQPHTYEARLQQIIERCAAMDLKGKRRGFASPEERAVLHSRNLHVSKERQAPRLGIRILEPFQVGGGSPEALNNLAVLLVSEGAACSLEGTPLPTDASHPVRRADALLARLPQDPVALLNRARVAEMLGDLPAMDVHLAHTIENAHNVENGILLGGAYDGFRLDWERIAWEHPAQLKEKRAALLRSEAWALRGTLREKSGDVQGALACFSNAVQAWPQVEALHGLCRAHAAHKQWHPAREAAAAALAQCPLYLQLRWARLEFHKLLGDHERLRAEAADMLTLMSAMRSLGNDLNPVAAMLREATMQAVGAHLGDKKYREALAVLHESLRSLPADRALQRRAGVLHAILGQDAEALRLLGPPSPQDDGVETSYRAMAERRERTRQALAHVPSAPPTQAQPGGPLRVAHLHAFLPAGGVEQYILDLVRGHGDDVQHEIFLYEDGGELIAEAEAAGARVHVFKAVDGEGTVDLPAFEALVQRLREGRFDVAHVHFGGGTVIGHEAARRAGIPHRVETVHWTVNSISQADAVICPSQLIMDLQADPSRAVRIPLGIDADRFTPRSVEPSAVASSSGTELCVGRVSRLVAEKDPATFVRAAARVQKVRPDVNFLLVGDGPQRAELETLAESEGARIDFAGSLRGDDLVRAYQSMDVFAYTPRAESYGLVVAEAMACGLPIVCSPVDAIPELVRHNHNGTHVPPADADALARAVLGMLDNAKRRTVMGARSRAAIEQSLTRQHMVAAHEDLYRRVCSRPLVMAASGR